MTLTTMDLRETAAASAAIISSSAHAHGANHDMTRGCKDRAACAWGGKRIGVYLYIFYPLGGEGGEGGRNWSHIRKQLIE